MEKKGPCKLYEIRLWDPAAPGFVSRYKSYFGTMQDIQYLQSVLEKTGSEEGSEKSVAQSLQKFFDGKRTARNEGIYGNSPILMEKEIFSRNSFTLAGRKITHYNTWGYEYMFRFEQCKAEGIILPYTEGCRKEANERPRYLTAIRCRFINLEYQAGPDESPIWRRPKADCFWGTPGVLASVKDDKGNDVICTRFYLEGKAFGTMQEAGTALTDLKDELFGTFLDEILGDG